MQWGIKVMLVNSGLIETDPQDGGIGSTCRCATAQEVSFSLWDDA